MKVGTKRVGILEQHRWEVMAIIAEHPDFYLGQYQELLRERLAINVSTVTIHNFLKKQGMTPKKDLLQCESQRRGGAKGTTSL